MNSAGVEDRPVLNNFSDYLRSGYQSLQDQVSPIDIELLHDLFRGDIDLDLEAPHLVAKVHDLDLKLSLVPIPKHIFISHKIEDHFFLD